MRKQQLNTAVRITYPKKPPYEFKTIEEASDFTLAENRRDCKIKYLTVAMIKMRANKYATADRIVPKDNIICEWLDDHTIRYYRAKRAKSRGSGWEYKIRDNLKKIGFKNIVTARGESRNADNNNIDLVDLDNKLPVSIQAKSYKSCPDYNSIRQGCDVIDKPFVIGWQNSNCDDWFAARKLSKDIPIEKELFLVPADFFYKLLEGYSKYNKII